MTVTGQPVTGRRGDCGLLHARRGLLRWRQGLPGSPGAAGPRADGDEVAGLMPRGWNHPLGNARGRLRQAPPTLPRRGSDPQGTGSTTTRAVEPGSGPPHAGRGPPFPRSLLLSLSPGRPDPGEPLCLSRRLPCPPPHPGQWTKP